MTTDERIERLTSIVEPLAGIMASHDKAIMTLMESSTKHNKAISVLLELAEKHEKALASLERQLQAYITTVPPH